MRLLPRIALLEIGMMVMMDYFCVLLLMNGRPHGNRDLYKCLQHLIRENQGLLDDDAQHLLAFQDHVHNMCHRNVLL